MDSLDAAGFALTGMLGALLRAPRLGAVAVEVRALPAVMAARIARGVRQGFAVRPVRLLSLAEAIVLFAWAPYWMEWPLLFSDGRGGGVWVVGWIFCGALVVDLRGIPFQWRMAGTLALLAAPCYLALRPPRLLVESS